MFILGNYGPALADDTGTYLLIGFLLVLAQPRGVYGLQQHLPWALVLMTTVFGSS